MFSLAGAALAWMVVKTSVTYALVDLNPYAVSKIAPDDPRVAMNIALIEFAQNNGAISERARRRSYEAMARAPLADTPMLVAALQALAAGDDRKGEALLVEARRREPRFRAARLLLLDRYLRTNRVAEAGEEIAVLARLLPQATDLLVPKLAAMAADPQTGTGLMRALRSDPHLQQEVLSKLAATADPDTILRIAREASPLPGAAPDWQEVLLNRLVGGGDYSRGYALWRSFAGLPASSDEKSVYDGRFQNLRGAAPFNWQLVASAAGVAERTSGGALQVQYFGRDPADLASQLLLLRPGDHALRFQADGDASGEGTRLTWSIACVSGTKLVEAPLIKVSSSPRTITARFTVPPAGCSAQWLRLSGIPAEYPAEQDAAIRDIRVDRIGG
ncbi:MAG: hypothetical protein JWP15_1444 [Alphaproteobacteria bacterium]|nr:hypothetical protein [Alphaproteobacteria bacterium]